MIHSCFGDQIDIHGGGSDLIFPHHENEIAQSESRFGKPLAHIWMHNGMLQIHGEKMSKSLGNLMTIDEFNSKFGAGTLRLMVLLGKYRNPLNFNDDLVSQAQQAQAKLRAAVDVPAEGAMPSVKLHAIAEAAEAEFKESLADDLTTARAVAALFKPASSINSHAARQSQEGSVASAQEILKRLVGVLGITVEDDSATMINMTALKDAAGEINAECESESTADVAGLSDAITTVVAACQEDPPKPASIIDSLIALREQLRRAKKFELADRIRGHLKTAGVELHDGKASRKWSVSR